MSNSIKDITEKLENLKQLKNLFLTQINMLSRFIEKDKININKKQKKIDLAKTKLSFEIIKQNLKEIKESINILSSSEYNINETKEIDNITKVCINLQNLANIIASEFIYINKKLKKDLKKQKVIPKSLIIEAKKVKSDIETIEFFINKFEKLLPLPDDISRDEKKKHNGFITTALFIKKKLFFAELLNIITKNTLDKKLSLIKLNPKNILNPNNIFYDFLIKKYEILNEIRNDVFSAWESLINEVLFHATQEYYTKFSHEQENIKNFNKEIKQILSKALIDGIDLLIFPQKETLYRRLKTYAKEYIYSLEKEKKDNVRYLEMTNNKNNNGDENNREDINNIIFNRINRDSITYIPSPEESLEIATNIDCGVELIQTAYLKAIELNLKEEANVLKRIVKALNNDKNLNGLINFGKDYNKKKLKGSIEFLIRLAESKLFFYKLKKFKNSSPSF